MFKYMIPIIQIIQQRILHHEELDELKAALDSNAINEFGKFIDIFASDKNVADRKILNSLSSIDDESKDLIEVDNDGIGVKYEKVEDDAKMMKNKYGNAKYEDEEVPSTMNTSLSSTHPRRIWPSWTLLQFMSM